MNVLRGRFYENNGYLNVLTLLIFEVIYKILGTYTIFKLIYYFTIRTIRGVEGTFYSTGLYLNKAANVIILILLLLILAFYFLYEISVLIKGFSHIKSNTKVNFFRLLKEAFDTTLRYLKPVNWIGVLLVFIFLPVLHWGARIGIYQIFYLGEILKTALGLTEMQVNLIGAILFFVVYFGIIFLSFTYVLFVECDVNFIASFFLSMEAFSKRFWKTVFRITWVLIKIFLVALLFMLAIFLIGYLSYGIMLIFNHYDPQVVLFRYFLVYMAPLFVLFALLFSAMSTFYFFLSVYELLYGSLRTSRRTSKTLLFVAILICVIYALINGSIISDNISDESLTIAQNGSLVTGHRGNMKIETDNTRASFDSAIDNGADIVELDVFQSLDGVIMVSHDDNLQRQTGQNLTITSSTYEQLKNLELTDFTRRTSPGQKILTLNEALEHLKGRAAMMIELKDIGDNPQFIENVVEEIHNSGATENCYIISTNYNYLDKVKALDSNLKTLYIIDEQKVDLDTLSVDGLCIEEHNVNEEIIDEAHLRGKLISAWPLQNQESIQKMIDLGVDNLITNDVGLGDSLVINSAPGVFGQVQNVYELIFRQV